MKRRTGAAFPQEPTCIQTLAPPEPAQGNTDLNSEPSPEFIKTVAIRGPGALPAAADCAKRSAANVRRLPLPTTLSRLPQVPGYEVLNELGRGGMGVVYRAMRLGLKRIVALKTLVGGPQAHDDDLLRFRAEAEAVARLGHPNIVQIYEVGEVNGQPFFAMEYVEGGSLADKRGTALVPGEAARLVALLARAMSHAHAHGIVHRDLKPDNILLTPDGQPKITDFGIAKYLDNDAARTRTGAVMGTPAYMAPEQAMGRVREIGPATDVYALGAILYELLTARPPIEGDNSLHTLQRIALSDPAPPRRLRQDLPRDLESICLKCLEREPARRYTSAGELADDLERFLHREPVQARPLGQVGRMARWCQRNRMAAALVFVVAAVFLGGLPAMTYLAWWNRTLFVESEANRRDAEVAQDEVRQSDRTARGRVARLHAATGVRLLGDGDLHRALVWTTDALRRTAELRAEEARQPDWQEHALRMRAAALIEQCPRLTHNLTLPSWAADVWLSADGQHVCALSFDRGQLGKWRLDDGTEDPWPFDPRANCKSKFTRDGRWAFVTYPDNALRLWDVAANRPVRELEKPTAADSFKPAFVTVSADGAHIFAGIEAGKGESHGWLWHAANGKLARPKPLPVVCTEGFWNNVRQGGFSRDGQRLLVSDCPKSVVVCDAQTGQEAYGLSPGNLEAVALSADGNTLALAFGNSVRLWNVNTRTERKLASPMTHAAPILRLVFDARGQRLLTTSDDGTTRVWNVVNGAALSEPMRHGGGVRLASFSPDERWILTVSNDGAARVWDLHGSLPLTPHLRHGDAVTSAAWTPDGSRVLTLAADGSLRIWDLAASGSGRLLLHDGPVNHVRFSPEGQRLLTGTEDGVAHVWDVAAAKSVGAPMRHADPITLLHWDGRVIVTVAGQAARAWDAASGRPLTAPLGRDLANGLGVGVAAASSAHGRLAIQFVDKVNLFDRNLARDVTQVTHSEHGWRHIAHLTYSPDGKYLATSGGYAASIWNAHTGANIHRLDVSQKNLAFRLTFTPDGRCLEAAHGGGVRMWETSTGRSIVDWTPGVQGLRQACLSPDRDYGLTVNGEDTCQVWDVAANRPAGPQFNLGGMCVLAEFAGGADQVVTVRADGEARLWDWHTGEPLTPPLRHGARVAGAALSPDRRVLAVAGRDGAVRLWTLPRADTGPEEELDARARLLAAHQVADKIELGLVGLRALDLRTLQDRYPRDPGGAELAEALAWHARQADEARRAGQWQAVIFQVDRLLALRPTRTDWLRQRAEAQAKTGLDREALAGFSRVCTQPDATPDDRMSRGRLHAKAARWTEALDDFRAATKLPANQSSWWLWRALAAAQSGEPDDAESSYREIRRRALDDHLQGVRKSKQRASQQDPQDLHEARRTLAPFLQSWDDAAKESASPSPFLHRLRGLAAALVEDWKLAEERFAEAARLDDADVEARHGLALAAVAQEAWQAALHHATRACELDPHDGSLRLLRTYALIELRRPGEALTDLDQAIAQRAHDTEARALRGLVRRMLGRTAEAVADFTFAIENQPGKGKPTHHFERGNAFAQLGQWQSARADFQQAAAMTPTVEKQEYALALAALKTGRADDYHQAVHRLLPLVPDKVVRDIGQFDITNSVVWIAVLGPPVAELTRCLPAMEAVVKEEPKAFHYRNTLGALLVRTGRHEQALVHLQSAIDLQNGDGTAWDWLFLARACQVLGRHEEAQTALGKARDWIQRQAGGQVHEPAFWRGPLTWQARTELELLAAEMEAALKSR